MELLRRLDSKKVHLVGVTSLEIADVACFLGARGVARLIGHDLSGADALFESFRAAHIGMPKPAREAHWERLRALDMELRSGDAYLRGIDEAEVVIVSQAWRLYPQNERLRGLLERDDVTFLTPVEVYLDVAAERGVPSIGVTGSNGKSTTANMVGAMVEAGGRDLVLAGNYRYRGPILEELARLDSSGVLVLEISNHHLLAIRRGPLVGVVTNVTPNHLEEHGGWDAYVAVKRRMAETQPDGATLVLNADDPVSSRFAEAARGRVEWLSLEDDRAHATLVDGRLCLRSRGEIVPLLEAAALPMPGRHNVYNALAAALAARAVGVERAAVVNGLTGFRGPPGRLELVREVAGVRFFWDIESTTPSATTAALETFPEGRVHLIAGGDDKGLDYGPLAGAIAAHRARPTLLAGTATPLMQAALEHNDVPVSRADTLEEAVAAAFGAAEPGDVVLVSPGAKAFYNRHVRGGPSYARLVKRLRAKDRGASPRSTP